MTTKIKLTAGDVTVEVEATDVEFSRAMDRVTQMMREASGHATPRQQMGFASQSLERKPDRHVAGDPLWRYGSEPATCQSKYEGKSMEELDEIMASDAYRNPHIEMVSCPLCPATSQDLAAHYADYHPGAAPERGDENGGR